MPHTETIDADLAVLVVVDVQEKLLPLVTSDDTDTLTGQIVRLTRAAGVLGVPVLYTEQYPKGLGPTVEPVRTVLPAGAAPIVKSMCSCWRDAAFREALQQTGREHVILVGLETHVCVQQTALDLRRVDYVPFVAADAVGSRRSYDKAYGLRRMEQAGVVVTTVESVIFELVERCDHPRFKEIIELVK